MTQPAEQPHHEGWVKLYRSLLTKPIWTETTAEQKVLLISLLMKAAYTKRTWIYQGTVYHLEPGQLITSINSLIELGGTGVTHRKVRTALTLFEKCGFLTQKTSQKNTLITIANWETYQSDPALPTQAASQTRHSGDTQASHQPTTNKKLRSKEGVEGEDGGVVTPPPPAPPTQPPVPSSVPMSVPSALPLSTLNHEIIVAQYNMICTELPKVRKLTNDRRAAIDASWQCLSTLLPGMAESEAFAQLFKTIQHSCFLKGNNTMKWRADFDWLMTPDRVRKVLEEKYERVHEQPTARASDGTNHGPGHRPTGFHLPESRGKNYTNDQLEAILLGKKSNKERRVNA